MPRCENIFELSRTTAIPDTGNYVHIIGKKQYEFSNHLGNVLANTSDKLLAKDWNNDNTVDSYKAEILSATDYTPFGVAMDGRTFSGANSRYGFNGQEKDDEVAGSSGSHYDYGARMYDARLRRWMSIDPLSTLYPEFSPYNFCLNSPLQYVDDGGLGINGGFSVENNSSQPITIVGSGQVVNKCTVNGCTQTSTTQMPSSGSVQITLQPGERYETYQKVETSTDANGNSTASTTWAGRIVHTDGTTTDAVVYDVDFIKIQEGQAFQVEGEGNYTNDNTKPKPDWYDQGEIKLQSSILDAGAPGGSENEAQVVIKDTGKKDESGNQVLNITTEGDYLNQPNIIPGDPK